MKTLGIGTLNKIDKSWGEEKTETDNRAVGRSKNPKGGGALCVEIGFYADIS